jgi:hypothetical protein
MTSIIKPERRGPERLQGESSRAYAAYCAYRDIGPGRSLDRAWKQSAKQESASARRPGHWSAWSAKFDWSERAEAYDDSIEEDKRSADVARGRQIHQRRQKFALEAQERTEGRVRHLDSRTGEDGESPAGRVHSRESR